MKLKIEPHKLKAFGVGILLMGIVFLLIIWINNSEAASFRENGEETMAVVTDVEVFTRRSKYGEKIIRRSVYVSYTVDGVVYNQRLAGYYNGISEGQQIKIIYKPENPAVARAEIYKPTGDGFLYVSTILAVAGAAILVLSYIKGNASSSVGERKKGTPVIAKVISVTIDDTRKIKGRHPYKALCEARNDVTGERFLYCSDGVENNIARLKGKNVIVYVNPADPEKYYVDLDSVVEA